MWWDPDGYQDRWLIDGHLVIRPKVANKWNSIYIILLYYYDTFCVIIQSVMLCYIPVWCRQFTKWHVIDCHFIKLNLTDCHYIIWHSWLVIYLMVFYSLAFIVCHLIYWHILIGILFSNYRQLNWKQRPVWGINFNLILTGKKLMLQI